MAQQTQLYKVSSSFISKKTNQVFRGVKLVRLDTYSKLQLTNRLIGKASGSQEENAKTEKISSHPVQQDTGGAGATVDLADSTAAEQQQARYAGLHDFCMGIPGSILLILFGLVAKLKQVATANEILLSGLAIGVFTYRSLKAWKVRESSSPSTGSALGVTCFLTYRLYNAGYAGHWHGRPILAVAGALAVFLIYNLLAGGNPPKSQPTPEAIPDSVLEDKQAGGTSPKAA